MRRIAVIAALALIFLVAGGTAADTFAVTVVSQTSTTITLGWTPQPGYGYLFSSAGVLRSRTSDPNRSTVTFAKVNPPSYDVDVIVKGANGHCCVVVPDTTAPTVSVTAPANGSTVSGTISETATANDNIGVVRVEFLRDGTLFATDTTSPYSASFNTTTVANGSHTFGARAFDAANNVGTATNVTVTVNNVAPPTDTTPPAKPVLSIGPVGQTTAVLNWQAGSDNIGVDHYNVWLGTQLVTPTTSLSYTYTGLTCNTSYLLGLEVVDAAGNKSNLAEARWGITTLACDTPPPPVAQCADGIDNTDPEDTLIDYPADPGCTSASDNDETDSPTPPPTGFPNAANTGVPSGTNLTAYTGSSNITQAGTVIDGKTMGCITVSATNVVIRNSRISCGGSAYYSVQIQSSAGSVRLEDSEIDCLSRNANGAGRMFITLVRVEIRNCENGLSVAHDVTVQDSWIHDLYHGNGAHSDGLQFEGSAYNVNMLHSTILGVGQQGEITDAAFIADLAGHHDWLVENNLFGGGGYTVYCVLGKGTNWIIRNNAFTLQYGQNGTSGKFGFSTQCGDETQSGNYVLETGQQIHLG